MIQLYGTVRSRAFRCLWMLEECGVSYELVPTDYASDAVRKPQFLTLNPNGKVPLLVDGDVVLFESLAINLYLASRYMPSLWPAAQAELMQWMMWCMGELEGPHDAANRSQLPIDAARLDRSLEALRRQIRTQGYVLGDRFCVADLNVAAVLMRPQYRPIARADATLAEWFGECSDRPALQRALAVSA